MKRSDFEFDRRRYSAASQLQPKHFEDFSRLVKVLRFGSRFQLLVLEFNDVPYRDALIKLLDEMLCSEGLDPVHLTLSPSAAFPTFAEVETQLASLAGRHQALHLLGGEAWFDAARWQQFNLRREAVAQRVASRLLLWLTTASISRMAIAAPDIWAWRSGVFSFVTLPQLLPAAQRPRADLHLMQHASKFKRIAELHNDLGLELRLPQDIRLRLWDELAGLLESVGELDEALRILKDEVLVAFERLGDVRSKAVTQGKIADILQARGELDEALRIREEEELPVYERLGDVRSKAVTQGQIADILQARGELDEALRIREEEELPVYERLGDVRSKAVTQGKIADILQARGELDEALRILKDEALVAFERLGDVRSKAVTQGQIADILQARGELDEALRIWTEEVLPIFQRLRLPREIAWALRKIGELEQTSRPRS